MKNIFGVLCFVLFAAAAAAQNQGQSGRSPSGDVRDAFASMEKAFENGDEELTLEDDYYLGRAVAAEILKLYKLYTKDAGLISYLNKICLAIVVNSSHAAVFNGYHVGILDSQEINAVATPGGHIFLTRGLIQCAESEDALAAVIAHELAHIQLRHAAAIITDQRLVNELSQTADRAASMAARNANARQQALLYNRNILSAMITTIFKNGFAQEQEFEADVTAVTLLRNAGYDPSALAAMLRVLEKTQPLRPGGFNTTHPSPAARLANLEKVLLTGGDGNTSAYRERRFSSFWTDSD